MHIAQSDYSHIWPEVFAAAVSLLSLRYEAKRKDQGD